MSGMGTQYHYRPRPRKTGVMGNSSRDHFRRFADNADGPLLCAAIIVILYLVFEHIFATDASGYRTSGAQGCPIGTSVYTRVSLYSFFILPTFRAPANTIVSKRFLTHFFNGCLMLLNGNARRYVRSSWEIAPKTEMLRNGKRFLFL